MWLGLGAYVFINPQKWLGNKKPGWALLSAGINQNRAALATASDPQCLSLSFLVQMLSKLRKQEEEGLMDFLRVILSM